MALAVSLELGLCRKRLVTRRVSEGQARCSNFPRLRVGLLFQRRRFPTMPGTVLSGLIGVPQVLSRRNAVADKLLEFFHLWKAAMVGARPDQGIVDADFEDPAAAGHQRSF